MQFQPDRLINILLAIIALFLYYRGSLSFYRKNSDFLIYISLAIFLDAITAVLGSFGITPTTIIPGSDFVPWNSVLFIIHVILATSGFFGFITLIIYILMKGKNREYPRLRKFQYKILLPTWLMGESIALINSIVKIIFGFRLYDYV